MSHPPFCRSHLPVVLSNFLLSLVFWDTHGGSAADADRKKNKITVCLSPLPESVLVLPSLGKSDRPATHIAREWCDATTVAGGSSSDNCEGSNEGSSWWGLIYKFSGSFEPYVEFVPYSTWVLGSKGPAVGWGIGHYPTAPLIVSFWSFNAHALAPAPSTHGRLAVCAAVWSDVPSVTSIGLISGGHKIVTFVTKVFGRDRCLNNCTRTRRIDEKSNM